LVMESRDHFLHHESTREILRLADTRTLGLALSRQERPKDQTMATTSISRPKSKNSIIYAFLIFHYFIQIFLVRTTSVSGRGNIIWAALVKRKPLHPWSHVSPPKDVA